MREIRIGRLTRRLVGDFLRDEVRIVDALDLTGVTPDRLRTILRRAAAAADDLGDARPEHQRRLLHLLLHRVTLHPGSIHIALKRSGLGSLVFGKAPDTEVNLENLIDLTVPSVLKRRGVEANPSPPNSLFIRGALKRDMDRAGVKRDTVQEALQKPTLALGPLIAQVTRDRRRTTQDGAQAVGGDAGQV